MNERIETTQWVRIVSGPLHRKDEERTGVVDGERMYPSGRCLRVIDDRIGLNWGWIDANHLALIDPPKAVNHD